MSEAKRIQVTKNYRLFNRHGKENRPINAKKHRKLLLSMKKYGFLSCFPVVCRRDKDGNLEIKDGQHRHMIAETLDLPVYWVEAKEDFDVADINNAQEKWIPRDYAQKWAANGHKSYVEGIEFAELHRIPLTLSFSLLSGNVSFSNIADKFYRGEFRIKDRGWADLVVKTYIPMTLLSAQLRNPQFLISCMRCCRVSGFDPERLIHNAGRCREQLVRFGTVDAYLKMMEDVYNFGRRQQIGLKAEATMAMRERSPAKAKTSENGVAAS